MEKSGPNGAIASMKAGPSSDTPTSRVKAGTIDKQSANLSIALEEQIREMKVQVSDYQLQLAKARRKPSKVFGDLALYRLLDFLSCKSVLPARMAARFRRSAAKRDPLRSLPETFRAEIEAALDAGNDKHGRVVHTVKSDSAQMPNPAKSTVMVVSHDTSRTGAPILALNIAQQLAKKYNIVFVVLGGGALRDEFAAIAVAMYDFSHFSEGKITASVKKICSQHEFSYALVNSVESRRVLPALKAAGVSTIALLHEFASYTRPRSAFSDVFRDADQVIFSTRITLENAIDQYGMARGTALHVLPQGKCVVPGGKLCEAERDSERRWLDSILRPNGEEEREFVVLGAGTIEPRKSVDLFLECATRVIGSRGGGRFRFVWIGGGYNPDSDMLVSAYLADQIKRAGIQSQVSIARPTSEIEYAYRLADALLLSSRLDPLPNVAIDALVAGAPVLCFERTTGIADFLLESGLGQNCVAKYIDTNDMAEKVLALANDDALRSDVALRGRKAALQRFDFERYIGALDSIASNTVPTAKQLDEDAEFLLASDQFRSDFFCTPEEDADDTTTAVRRYLETNRSGIRMRKPTPGFNPGIFAERNQQGAGADPFVRFLRDDKPIGPWSLTVIDEQGEVRAKEVAGTQVALHLHVNAPEELAEIGARLSCNAARPDVFISTTADREAGVKAALPDLPWPVKAVAVVPDRGRGVGALLTAFGSKLVREYEIIGHIDVDATDDKEANSYSYQLENLIGGEHGGAMIDRVLTAMASDPDLGIVYPDDPDILNWGDSRAAADRLARRLGIDRLPDQINFPASGMFWMRRVVLRRFMALNLEWDDYPPGEPLAEDTVVDALSRLFGVVPVLDGLQVAATNVRGNRR